MEKYKKQVVVLFSLFSLLVASLAPVSVHAENTNTSSTSEYTIAPRERGSCRQLVKLGLLSPRSCGYVPGRPKGGEIYLTKKQWDCVLNVYGLVAKVAVNVPITLGGGVILILDSAKTINACVR